MELVDIVMKLTGPVTPVGDSCVDAVRLENLVMLRDLTGALLDHIREVAEATDDHLASVKVAKEVAAAFLASNGVPEVDRG